MLSVALCLFLTRTVFSLPQVPPSILNASAVIGYIRGVDTTFTTTGRTTFVRSADAGNNRPGFEQAFIMQFYLGRDMNNAPALSDLYYPCGYSFVDYTKSTPSIAFRLDAMCGLRFCSVCPVCFALCSVLVVVQLSLLFSSFVHSLARAHSLAHHHSLTAPSLVPFIPPSYFLSSHPRLLSFLTSSHPPRLPSSSSSCLPSSHIPTWRPATRNELNPIGQLGQAMRWPIAFVRFVRVRARSE